MCPKTVRTSAVTANRRQTVGSIESLRDTGKSFRFLSLVERVWAASLWSSGSFALTVAREATTTVLLKKIHAPPSVPRWSRIFRTHGRKEAEKNRSDGSPDFGGREFERNALRDCPQNLVWIIPDARTFGTTYEDWRPHRVSCDNHVYFIELYTVLAF